MDAILWRWLSRSAMARTGNYALCANVGVVYTGIKPSAILQIPTSLMDLNQLVGRNFSFRVIGEKNGRYSVFLYHPRRVAELLNRQVVQRTLRQLGYPETFSMSGYLNHLLVRLRTEKRFPHEVGFFLGYPPKDVLGYLGMVDLPLNRIKGWHIYGNPRPSEEVYARFWRGKREIANYARMATG